MAIPTNRSTPELATVSESEQDSQQPESHDYGFPYRPYGIQQDFMAHLQDVLNAGGVGLFESPTGTGKTLSLICGTLDWLEKKASNGPHTASKRSAESGEAIAIGVPDWIAGFQSSQGQEAASPKPGQAVRDTRKERPRRKRQKLSHSSSSSESDREVEENRRKSPHQVLFCSRTHSQLSQFVGELRRTPYAKRLSLAALASRQTLCINKEVKKLKSAAWINEKCLDLQQPAADKKKKKKKTGSSCCPFMKASASAKEAMQDRILGSPMDVEELSRLGAQEAVCPYYASRSALSQADLVLLPYASLLSKEAREALGLEVRGSIIIIDEAHNLVAALNSAYASSISLQQLQVCSAQLQSYHEHYRARLAPGNEHSLQLLIHVTEALLSFLQQTQEAAQQQPVPQVTSVNSFLFATGLDNVNLFALLRYTKESQVLFKAAGFADAQMAGHSGAGEVSVHRSVEEDTEANRTGSGTGALQALMGFFHGLNNRDADGRILTDPAAGTYKFMLLNAASHFAEVLEMAHSVVLASGTLAPVELLQRLLFPSKTPSLFSCGHIIPEDHLLAMALGKGPSGAAIDLRHPQRSQPAAIHQLGHTLLNVSRVVAQGIVVFFPSFSYAAEVEEEWVRSGLWAELARRKRLLREPRNATEVEGVLTHYAECIAAAATGEQERNGAILLCVVGGKMSEGINFGDGLGRCVVMVGMPYPNPTDPELVERMRYIDESGRAQQRTATVSPGQDFYENLCMKAVNQCIGRVVRHKDDWACILLLDARWSGITMAGKSPREKLPGWIRKSLVIAESFGSGFSQLAKFCRAKSQAGK